MDREDYDKRIDLVLSEGAYAKIPRDPTKNVEKMIRDNLQKLLRNKEMTRDFHIQMHHSSTVYQKCTRQTFPCVQLSTLGDHLLIAWPNIWLESLHCWLANVLLCQECPTLCGESQQAEGSG